MTIECAEGAYDGDDARLRWGAWYRVLCRRWYGFARHTLDVQAGDADDLVHEVVLRTLRRHIAAPFPSIDDAARWGATVLANLVRDRERHERRHGDDVSLQDVPETATDSCGDPHEALEDEELARQVEAALDSLRPSDRAAIRARFHDGLTYSEAAALFGIGEGAFGVRLHRALQKLRIQLGSLTTQHLPAPLLTWQPGRRARGGHGGVTQAVAGAATVLTLAGTYAAEPTVPPARPPAVAGRAPDLADPAEPWREPRGGPAGIVELRVSAPEVKPRDAPLPPIPVCVDHRIPPLCRHRGAARLPVDPTLPASPPTGGRLVDDVAHVTAAACAVVAGTPVPGCPAPRGDPPTPGAPGMPGVPGPRE